MQNSIVCHKHNPRQLISQACRIARYIVKFPLPVAVCFLTLFSPRRSALRRLRTDRERFIANCSFKMEVDWEVLFQILQLSKRVLTYLQPGMMLRRVTRVLLLNFASLLWASAGVDSTPLLTPAAAGPYRVEANRILDSKGRPFLLRGTELPTLTLNTSDIAGDGKEFGAFSASSLVSIRQRLNMNAVRLPVSPHRYLESETYRVRVREVVESANRFELLVILAVDPADALPAAALAQFWTHSAADFKSCPNLFFAPDGPPALLTAVRASWRPTARPAGRGRRSCPRSECHLPSYPHLHRHAHR